MNWYELNTDELAIFSEHLKAEPLELDTTCRFKRYARRKGEGDRLVQFEPGVTLRVLRAEVYVVHDIDSLAKRVVLYEPNEQLFVMLNGADFETLFSAECQELMNSTALYALKQHAKQDLERDYGGREDYGLF